MSRAQSAKAPETGSTSANRATKLLRVSVCVCTHNRAALLKRCLASLTAQDADHTLFEVLVIDNNSTDESAYVGQAYANAHSNARVVLETNQGLSHARNRGFREARAPYVAFIDDDAIAEPDWICGILTFLRDYPNAVAFGGPYSAYFERARPSWFGTDWGSLNHGTEAKSLGPAEWVSGTNIVFRRSVLLEFGGFDAVLGMSGNRLGYGEETALQLRLKNAGHTVYYSPNQRVRHLVAPYKLSPWWWLRSSYAAGKTRWDLAPGQKRRVSMEVWRLLRSLAGIGWRILRCRERHLLTRLLVATRPFAWRLGSFVAAARESLAGPRVPSARPDDPSGPPLQRPVRTSQPYAIPDGGRRP